MSATCEPAGSLYSSEPLGLSVFLAIGLLGGAHCVGMCGPLVTLYADRMQTDGGRDHLTLGHVRQHGLFNLGRTVSYATLGGLFGLAGSLVFVSGRRVTAIADDVHAVSGLLIGAFILAVGLQYAAGRNAHEIPVPGLDRLTALVTTHLTSRVDRWVGDARIAGLGAVHGLLPCPLLYPAFLYAFVQGSPAGGVAALGALGLGTVPAVFLTGTVFQSANPSTRVRLHRVLGVAFLVLGYIPLQHGLAALGVPLPHPPIPYYQPL
jgi:sulfite exporter TauE/SafE